MNTSTLSTEQMQLFFSWLDLERKGLETVKEYVQNGDYSSAASALLVYFRHRRGICYYDGWEKPSRPVSYDTSKADSICNHYLVGQDMGPDIDWHANPHGDPEWTYCLNRHEFLTELGRAYWYTGDEKYTIAFKEILIDWIEKNPMPDLDWMLNVPSEISRMYFMKQGNWRPLTIGIRLYTSFIPCFYHFLDSPEMTPHFLIRMLMSMVEHARHNRAYYTRHKSYFNVSPNWGLMESNGLAHMGILFPEFKEAGDWRDTALARLEEQIRLQVLPDGMQVERASGYHLVCTFCFLQILDLALRNRVRVSDTYMKTVEKMIDFILGILKPHGYYPMLKDGDESDVFGARASYGLWEDINNLNMLEDGNDLRWVLKTGARLFNRPDMLYAATHGKEGSLPKIGSVAAPHAGFYTMRTGWNHDDLYLTFTCGPLGVMDQNCVHGHADALSIDVSGYGETLLIDPGRYLYEGPERLWFKGTSAHNTVVVDGEDSSVLADEWMFKTKANSFCRCWSSSDALDYVDGFHDGYQRLHDPVVHRRRICFVKPHFWVILDDLTARTYHTYEQYFHFAPQCRIQESEDLTVAAFYQNGAGIVVKPLLTESMRFARFHGSMNPMQGWVSYDYAVKVPAEAVRYSKRVREGVQFAALLIPFQEKIPDYSVTVLEPDVFRMDWEDFQYVLIFSDQPETKRHEFEFDGPLLCAKYDRKGNLIECYGVQTSRIVHQGRILLDSVIRHKMDCAVVNR